VVKVDGRWWLAAGVARTGNFDPEPPDSFPVSGRRDYEIRTLAEPRCPKLAPESILRQSHKIKRTPGEGGVAKSGNCTRRSRVFELRLGGCRGGRSDLQGSAGRRDLSTGDFGTVFKLTPSGAETVLHSFVAGSADGAYPEAGLIQGADGNLYGTTATGGTSDLGTVFKVTLE